MNVTLNGEMKQVPEDQTIRGLVESLGLGKAPVAVEINTKLVPRKEHEDTGLKEGDIIEIVTLVGGG